MNEKKIFKLDVQYWSDAEHRMDEVRHCWGMRFDPPIAGDKNGVEFTEREDGPILCYIMTMAFSALRCWMEELAPEDADVYSLDDAQITVHRVDGPPGPLNEVQKEYNENQLQAIQDHLAEISYALKTMVR